jgi:uncharacterized membrane protein YjjB (DUF3815 family)
LKIVIQLIAAWVGALGFALIFNSGKKTLIPSIFGGMLGWAVYLLFEHLNVGVFLATIAAAAFCQIYSEVFARILKAPTTVIYIPSIVPLVPGGSLYNTMYSAAINDWNNFRFYGATTLKVAFGIAVGASFVSAILLLLAKSKKV